MLIEKTGGFDRNNPIYVIDVLERAAERVYAAGRRLGLEVIRADRAEARVKVLEEAIDSAGFYPCRAASCACIDRWHAKNPAAFAAISALKGAP